MSQGMLIDSDILTSVDVDLAIADEAGEYMREFRKSHALSIGDAVIAATAKEMGMILVTRNIKHYPMKDVEIVKPY
jgi:predicted nucleic acid-binding protein